jgi:hypothetical protein
MRRKNPRIVIVGSALIVPAVAFFLFFLSTASKSNNPAELSGRSVRFRHRDRHRRRLDRRRIDRQENPLNPNPILQV